MAAPAASSERLGNLLVREGLITREQLEKALQEQRQSGTRVGHTRANLGFIPETELTKMLARQHKMPAVDLSKFEVDPRIAKLIPGDLAIKHLVLPLKRDGRTLTVAMADPTNLGVLDDLKFITRYDIFPVIGGEFTLKTVIEKLYETAVDTQVADLMSVIDDMGGEDIEVLEEKEEDVSAAALSAQMDDAPVVKLINAILTDAVKRGASDIHFECFEHDIRVHIMTGEDPVEYNLYGVNQVLVRSEIGMTFAAALKAFLRQDPTIIMVGEIRDLETGGIAIKAALTGHMVLSTLHTNSAPETVTRLMDMGLEPFNVASALNLVLAQRLLRRICSNCKVQYTPSAEEFDVAKVRADTTLRSLRFQQETIDNAKIKATKEAMPLLQSVTLDTTVMQLPFFKGKGCDSCNGTGMKGRQGVYEVMPMSPNLRRLILQSVGAAEIKDAAVDERMFTLRMDGWVKVMKGITTLEQVVRETSAQ